MLNPEDENLIRILQMKNRSEELLHGSNPHVYDYSVPFSELDEDSALYWLEYTLGNITKDELPTVEPTEKINAEVQKFYSELEILDSYKRYKIPAPTKYKHIFENLKNAGVFMGFVQLLSKAGKLSTALETRCVLLDAVKQVNRLYGRNVAHEGNTKVIDTTVAVQIGAVTTVFPRLAKPARVYRKTYSEVFGTLK